MYIALVIPSNREDRLREFFRAWRAAGTDDWTAAFIVEDAPERTFKGLRWPNTHLCQADARRILGNDAWIISRQDSACRALGLLVAAQHGAEWILTLDDDCLPAPGSGPICAAHLAAMQSHTVCQPTAGMRTRGLPYRNLGKIEPRLNMGLWRNVADVDGPTGLTPQPYFTPPPGSHLANPRQRYPICGMNLFFHRDMLPAMFFPPMGAGQPFRRFDDIWFGWAFQRLAQHCGIDWTYGEPCIEHVRASNPFQNLKAEAPGIAANESTWHQLNEIPLSASTLADATAELAARMRDGGDYFAHWGEALARWLRHTSEGTKQLWTELAPARLKHKKTGRKKRS